MATPIGNLEDITLRALRVLREVALIAAEDTRHSGRLLKHFQIDTPMISFHEHSDLNQRERVLDALNDGDVALISDAGTPGISDPGFELVVDAIQAGHVISPIPGPAAVTAAVPASGLVPGAFIYLGFLPRKARERRDALRRLKTFPYPLVLYEAPHRLASCLADLEQELGDRPLAVLRELTKLHEEIVRTSVSAARQRYAGESPRGEFVLVVGSAEADDAPPELESDAVFELLAARLEAGESPSATARAVARETGLPRSALYQRIQEIKSCDARE